MKRFILLLIVLVLSAAPALADLQAGFDAAQKGDYATAFREWMPLADQGDAAAQYNLGIMYDNGQGVAQDYGAAVKWYRKAADQGDADAVKGRDIVAKLMTPAQIAEGQRIARNWQPTK